MAQVQGHFDATYKEVQQLLQDFVASGEEVGASVAVNINGRNVVDIWAGYADGDHVHPWEKDTIVNLFSTTKTVTALAALMLIDRGQLDIDANISQYWPEFAANGKQDVKVRHLLSHRSGVSGWDGTMTVEDVCDFEKATSMLAGQAPWWTPGTASGYHSFTWGHLVGELVRRITGNTLKQFVSKEIATPLGADFQLGVLEKDLPRVADLISFTPGGDPPQLEHDSVAAKTLANPSVDPNVANSTVWRNAELGAANGHGNARSVARILSTITLEGEVDGVRLLSPKTVDFIFQEQGYGIDLVVGIPLRFGIGYGITGDGDTIVDDWIPRGRVCYWGGWGGSVVIMDLDRKVTIAYAMNKMDNVGLGSTRTKAYVKAIYQALGVI
ncbi:related to beta-lactamase [Phialocephala subalpina]|uniref:Related to beta-lactamase n=1 Tax=Phialocephala subalpina TaxID=576137 RepID=A0A1L7XX98_9HELO|nr:related to beta-lactamase [Phialocephala subalpina]